MQESYAVSFLDRGVCNIVFEKSFNCGKSSMSLDGTNIKLQIFLPLCSYLLICPPRWEM